MKTFSRLSLFTLVCLLGITLMFGGNTAEAQEAGMGVVVDPAKLIYEEGETVIVTFTVTNNGVPVQPVQPVMISWHPVISKVEDITMSSSGVLLANRLGTPVVAKDGQVILRVMLGSPAWCLDKNLRKQWTFEHLSSLLSDPHQACPTQLLQSVSAVYNGPVEGLAEHINITNEARFCTYCKAEEEPTIIIVHRPEPCVHEDGSPPINSRFYDYSANGNPGRLNLKVGDVFQQRIGIKNVKDLSAWQMNVVFNPSILEVVSIEEGSFLQGRHTADTADDADALFLASDGTGWIPVTDGHIHGADVETRLYEDSSAVHLIDNPRPDLDVQDWAKRANATGNFATRVAEGKIAAIQARIGRSAGTSDTADVGHPGSGYLEAPTDEEVGTGANQTRGVSGTGILMTICFRVLEYAEEPLGIHNVQLSDSNNDRINYSIIVPDVVVVTDMFPAEDVNRDGYVNIQDLVLVASSIGLVPGNLNNPMADANGDGMYSGGMYTEFQPPDNMVEPGLKSVGDSHARVDVNNDGIVNVLDLIKVASSSDWGGKSTITTERDANTPEPQVAALAAAPALGLEALTPATIQAWIDLAQVEDDGSVTFDLGIANLEVLLVSRIPSETQLLMNYPNPFNPETWIPYQLSEAVDVTVSIYTVNGTLVRTLDLGHQAAGVYKSKNQAAYWDGRNEFGERVASGIYFYTLTAGDFMATHKMLVRK
jgi:hypothetical protein